MENKDNIRVVVAGEEHKKYVTEINDTIQRASEERGTGIARRTDEYILTKMEEGKAVIAIDGDKFAGFCYIESWSHNKFVANSGLIVAPQYRGVGLAKRIKQKAFELSRKKFPDAKIFGLTTGLAVMKINSELGYKPVTFSELTDDEAFWKGCQSCVNYDILMRTKRTKCLCTAMLFDPQWEQKKNEKTQQEGKLISFKKWLKNKHASGYIEPFSAKLKRVMNIVTPNDFLKHKQENALGSM
ncbi:MAG: GNAT family N-acetyltransferase [Prolixibacteraceae bacterium]|nr:GNAT family N-acetyltransferase [Prolixibacteraceae bacterium]MBN2649078.1 GNAT family N-acetyltransferase [Prolixibacteraceae bacterium]